MLIALKLCIENRKVIVKKSSLGSISVIFNKKKPLVISDDSEVDLTSLGYSSDDLVTSNLEQLIKKGVLSLIVE